MCTLSWHVGPDKSTILFNRDESWDRKPELPPTHLHIGSAEALAPIDGNAGGSWIAVNDRGVALALLNFYPQETPAPTDPISRGLIFQSLLDLDTASQLGQRLRAISLDRVAPFRCFALQRQQPPVLVLWDRRELRESVPLPPLSSSSVDDVGIPAARVELFSRFPQDPKGLAAFHVSHLPKRGATSPCMHRDDARTCSHTRIVLEEHQATLLHRMSAPCEDGPEHLLSLDLE